MSFQDVRGFYESNEDDPPPARTIPDVVVPGERFMEEGVTRNRWDVLDWISMECLCVHDANGEGVRMADKNCSACKAGQECKEHAEQYWFAEYQYIVPPLVKAYQGLEARLAALEAKLAA